MHSGAGPQLTEREQRLPPVVGVGQDNFQQDGVLLIIDRHIDAATGAEVDCARQVLTSFHGEIHMTH
jgi:hypothetical protein